MAAQAARPASSAWVRVTAPSAAEPTASTYLVYGKTLGEDAFSLPEILEWGEERYQRMRREAEGEQPLDPEVFDRSGGDQEELIDILRSIAYDGRRISSVNVPNNGYVPNITAGAVLEIPGVATGRGRARRAFRTSRRRLRRSSSAGWPR